MVQLGEEGETAVLCGDGQREHESKLRMTHVLIIKRGVN